MKNTYTQESDFRQERDFGAKISATFEFIGAHFRPLGKVLLYLALPAALVQALLGALLQSQLLGITTGTGAAGLGVWQRQGYLYNTMFTSPFYYLNLVLGQAFAALIILSVYGYLLLCLRRPSPAHPITVADVWAVVRREFLDTFFSLWGVGILVVIGFALLFFPGVYLLVALSPFFIVRLVEKTGFRATISRCLFLTRGKWWSTFGLLAIMSVILYILLIALGSFVALISGGLALFTHPSNMSVLVPLTTAISTLFTMLLYPPLLLALAFQYFNLVERKEGRGLHALVGQLGQAPAARSDHAYRPDEEGEY